MAIEFTSEEINLLIDGLQRLDAFTANAEDHAKLCQLVAKVSQLAQSSEGAIAYPKPTTKSPNP